MNLSLEFAKNTSRRKLCSTLMDLFTYICNETHFRALQAAHLAQEERTDGNGNKGRLRAGFFIHVPYPEVEGDYGPLATATGLLIERLVSGSTQIS